ncbi:unnamed protein product [Orchesella dallaii]|uniref:RING-CH-type domain-containing protein n=1 Tax=Orchesella dallaii TaxID=48710 RepID=A0ABP1R6V9_9HEXA
MERWFKANSPEVIATLDGSTIEKKGGTCGDCGGGTTSEDSGGGEGKQGNHQHHHHSSSVTMTKSKDRNVSPESNNDSQKSYQFCRICHEGDGNCSGISPSSANTSSSGPREALIAPCRCTGSVAMVHLSCLEHWLTASNSEKCELCHFMYKTKKMPRTWTEFLTESDNQFNVRNMIADLICFFLLTPLLLVSTYLCVVGAHQYYIRERWEAAGLLTLSFFLLLVYFTWCHVTFKYHVGVWHTWERTHQRIRITFGDGSISEFRRRVPATGNTTSVVEMWEQHRRNNRLVAAMEEGNGGGGRVERDNNVSSSSASLPSSVGEGGNEEMMEDDGRYESTENLYIVNTNNNYNHRFPLHINRRALLHLQQPTFVLQAQHPHLHHQQQPLSMSSFFPAPARETHFPVDDSGRQN